MVGENPASAVYVRNKVRACNEVGITSIEHRLPQDCTDERLLEVIKALNEDATVDGILVQLPLPEHMHAGLILETIDPNKDVDGFHIYNTGKLVTTGGGFKPCTPAGIIELLKAIDYPIEGKHAVILGRSNIVGKPLAMLMLPLIIRSTEETLKMLPGSLKEAGLALGASYSTVILRVLLPSAFGGLFTGILLAVSRVLGETAPLMLTALGASAIEWNIFEPMSALPLQIWEFYNDPNLSGLIWSTSLFLLLLILVLNLLAKRIARKWKI